jgi:uncharacterized protein (TIGR03435 family)
MSRSRRANRSPDLGVQRAMSLYTTALLLVVSLSGLATQAAAQSTAISPAFDVASVKQSPPPTGGPMFVTYGPRAGGQWLAQNAPFLMILRAAYPNFALPGQIAGGPEWVNTSRFDVDARTTLNLPPDAMAEMLKNLLAERFRLKVHVEPREIEVYALVLARGDGRLGPGLRKPAVDCEAVEAARRKAAAAGTPPAQVTPPKPGERPECGMLNSAMNGVVKLATGGTPLSAVPTAIQPTVGRPVIDRTGLAGRWDIELEYSITTTSLTAADQPNAPTSVFTALQEQLGLKLESRKERMDVLVIDRIEMPTPN